MESILIIGSVLGILNSFILLLYPLISKKGYKTNNYLFSLFVLAIGFMASNALFSTFFSGTSILFTFHLIGLILAGPAFFLFTYAYVKPAFKLKGKNLILIIIPILLIACWFTLNILHTDFRAWNIYHRLVMLVFIGFLTKSLFLVSEFKTDNLRIKKQLYILGGFMLAIWFASLIHEIAGLRYFEEIALFSLIIYITIRIVYNKGYIIETRSDKYKKTGLKEEERKRILAKLKLLLDEEKIYRDNTISAAKMAKRLETSVHSLSQVINESYHYTFFELIGNSRISEAKEMLINQPEQKISDIAYHVGYNSLSAFNTAFKKQSGKTPTQYRDEKAV